MPKGLMPQGQVNTGICPRVGQSIIFDLLNCHALKTSSYFSCPTLDALVRGANNSKNISVAFFREMFKNLRKKLKNLKNIKKKLKNP